MNKIIFIPGNGGSTTDDNWFPKVKTELEAANLTVISPEFPDPDLARSFIWLPFLRRNLLRIT